MNKIVLLEIGFNFAFVEAVSQVLQTQLITNGVDLLLMLLCSLISRLLTAKIQNKMKGKNLFNILGLVRDLTTTVVEVVKTVKTIRKNKKNENNKR